MRGKFITLYGINNIGKTTQAELLVKTLKENGHKAVYVKYPVYDIKPSGPFINNILRSRDKQQISEDELQLWFIINRYQFQPKLKKLLEDGYIVIAEDYIGTGIAWGTAKGLNQRWLEEANKYLLKEDFAIFLEGKRTLKAKEQNHVHEQNDRLISRCIEVHCQLADKYGWKKVQIQPAIKKTAEILWGIVKNFLEKG